MGFYNLSRSLSKRRYGCLSLFDKGYKLSPINEKEHNQYGTGVICWLLILSMNHQLSMKMLWDMFLWNRPNQVIFPFHDCIVYEYVDEY